MAECSKCGKKLGFLSGKYKFEDGSVMCSSCFENLEEQRAEKNKKVMTEYISKYLSNKDMALNGCILGCYKNKGIYINFDEHSLDRVVTYFQTRLQETEFSSRSGLSSYEVDEIISTKKTYEETLNFLNDLEKMYRLFHKKGVDTNYFEILSIFTEVIEQNLTKEYDKILIPAYKRISKRLGENITSENVIKEFIRIIPTDIEHNFDVISKLFDFDAISKLFDKFNLKYEKGEVKRIIEEVREDIELKEFEQDLGSSQKIDIGDFERLNGYEFEEYLKGLFDTIGYTVVQTSLSGDQGADLIISKNGEKTVVQAKKYDGKVSNKAIQEIVAAKNHYKAQKAIVITNSSFTKSAIDLALSNNVELWDGLKLKNVIQSLKSKKKEKAIFCGESLTLKLKKEGDIQKIKIPCPLCEEEFEYELDTREILNFETKCPHCGNIVSAKGNWTCTYCSQQFDTESEAEEHEKTCEKSKK